MMICSMTAFSREQFQGDEGQLVWEIRSVNHRFLETFVRLPEELRALEPTVRGCVARRLKRGKLDCTLRYQPAPARVGSLRVNQGLVKQLLAVGAEVGELLGETSSLAAIDILRWPGVMQEQQQDLTPVEKHAADLLKTAVDGLIATRRREGAQLADVVRQRCRSMRTHVAAVRERMPQVMVEVRARIRGRLAEVVGQLDENRVEQEMAMLAQRMDVDEEMDRLATHLDEVERVLGEAGAIGRRLDFLMQELNREANTLTSKTSDVEVTRNAIEMKVLIEQMREQVQNIE